MNIKKFARILWVLLIVPGLFLTVCGVYGISTIDAVIDRCAQGLLLDNPALSQEAAVRDASMIAYGAIAVLLIWGITFAGAGFLGITGQGRLRRDRVRKVMLLLSVVIVIWGTEQALEAITFSDQSQLVHLLLGCACFVAGALGFLPVKWDKKFPAILVCVGIMTAMQIASIKPDPSNVGSIALSLVMPLVLVAFYVAFFVTAFKCMQLSCDFNPTISERIKAGEAINRPPAFYEQIETILMAKTDMLDLFYAVKQELPNDVELTALTDTEQALYLNAEYWSAIVEKQGATAESDVCAVRFPDFKVDFQVENEYRAIEEMNMALTAIEKAVLTLDAQAVAQVRHASTNERAANMASINNESADSLEGFTISGASRSAVNAAVAIGGGVVDDASSSRKNKQVADTLQQTEPLILRYLDTPALPATVRANAESLPDRASVESGYVAEATKEEASYKMTPNRKRQLARSVVGLVTVALLSTLFSFVINQSVPGAHSVSSVEQEAMLNAVNAK